VHGIDVSRVAHALATGSTKQAIASAPPGARGGIAYAARSAVVAGLSEILIVAAVVAFAGAAVGLLLVRSRDFVHRTTAAPVHAE
jgi:hypothetical protein